ncbi:MAG: hypothetical protein ABW007_19270 [Chitinophagaceae bacterium]
MKLRIINKPQSRVPLYKRNASATVAKKDPIIQRMEFLKSEFSSTAEVQTALDEHGWDIGKNKIVEKDDRFVITDAPLTKFQKGTVSEIDGPAEGFIVYAGKLTKADDSTDDDATGDDDDNTEDGDDGDEGEEGENADIENQEGDDDGEEGTENGEDGEETEDVEKTVSAGAGGPPVKKPVKKPVPTKDNPVAKSSKAGKVKKSSKEDNHVLAAIYKFDGWSASENKEATSIKDVIKASDDASPVGFRELTMAMQIALSNIMRSSKDPAASAETLLEEFGTCVMAMVDISKTAKGTSKAGLIKSMMNLTQPAQEEDDDADDAPVRKVKKSVSAGKTKEETRLEKLVESLVKSGEEQNKRIDKLMKAAGQSPAAIDDGDDEEDFEFLSKDAGEEDEDDESITSYLNKRNNRPRGLNFQ